MHSSSLVAEMLWDSSGFYSGAIGAPGGSWDVVS